MLNSKHVKDFDSWNMRKKSLQESEDKNILFRIGEIWWCSLGVNLGDEEDGKHSNFERPMLIFKKFNKDFSFAIPLTSNQVENKYRRGFVYSSDDETLKNGQVIVSQARPISTKRLLRKLGKVSYEEYGKIKSYVKEILG